MRSTPLALSAVLFAVCLGTASPKPVPVQRLGTTWFLVGEDGFSCVSCHTVSGRELFDSQLTREDFVRRGSGHLGKDNAELLAGQLVRAKPSTAETRPTRPLQPGGTVLGSDSDFEDKGQPLSELPVAIRFPAVSEDAFRAMDGHPLSDWIPDVGLSFLGTQAFIASTQDHPFRGQWAIGTIDAEIVAVEGEPKSELAKLARYKRLALLMLEAYYRTGKFPQPELTDSMPESPLWVIARWARSNQGKYPDELGIVDPQAVKLGLDPNARLDLKDMAAAWAWLAWTQDPGLTQTTRKPKSEVVAEVAGSLAHLPAHLKCFKSRVAS